MAIDPLVVQVMRRFKLALLARERIVMGDMARRWLQVEDALEAQITALAYEVAGGPVSQAKLFQLERYQRLLAQTQEQFTLYAGYADGRISAYQGENGRQGLSESVEAIRACYRDAGIRAGAFFRLPVEAIEFMIGSTRAGTPLGELLRERIDPSFSEGGRQGAWEYLTQALIKGTALGKNPRTVAREMRGALAGGFQKGLVIARTEGLRPYREASRLQYQESGVVERHRRLTAHDGRVCAACLAEEGQEFPVSVTMYDHPQGRCTSVPVVSGLPAVRWTRGEDWILTQGEDVQRSILGQGLYEAWKAGKIRFADIANHTFDSVWGGSLTPKSLDDLLGGQE